MMVIHLLTSSQNRIHYNFSVFKNRNNFFGEKFTDQHASTLNLVKIYGGMEMWKKFL